MTSIELFQFPGIALTAALVAMILLPIAVLAANKRAVSMLKARRPTRRRTR